jgi:hypothetical protein
MCHAAFLEAYVSFKGFKYLRMGIHTYIHTLHFISQVQTNGHKNRHIKTKQAPVNKIIKINFLCYAPHIRELYKKNYS